MNDIYRLLCYIIALVITHRGLQITLCATIADLSVDTSKSQELLYRNYLLASYQHHVGTSASMSQALKLYQELTQVPHPIIIYKGYFPLLFQTGQFQYLASLYKEHRKTLLPFLKENFDLTLITAQSLLSVGDQDAEPLFASLAKVHKENPQVIYYTTSSLINHHKLDQALRYVTSKLTHPTMQNYAYLFHFLVAKVHLLKHNYAQALEAINQSLKASPLFDKALLFKAMLLEQAGNIPGAIKAYTSFLNCGSQDNAIEKHLVSLLFSEQNFEQAAFYVRKMPKTTPEDYCNLALIELRAGNLQSALENIQISLTKNSTIERSQLLFIEIMLALHAQKPSEDTSSKLLAFLQEWIHRNPTDVNVINILLTLKNTTIKPEPIASSFNQLAQQHPESIPLQIAYADLCLEIKNYEPCIALYKNLLTKLTHDHTIQAAIFAQLGYTYFMLQYYKEAEETLITAMAQPVIHPASYNTLAYIYATQHRSYTQALELVEKAIKEEPTCAAYLDTKGYILSKLGKKHEALYAFQEALHQNPHDPAILTREKELHDNS